VELYPHAFLSSELEEDEWSALRRGRFTPGERAPSTHWIGGWVGPTASMDVVKARKIPSLTNMEAVIHWASCLVLSINLGLI
jgi:hypothetical protein